MLCIFPLSHNISCAVTPDILAAAVCRLEEVDLSGTNLTAIQLNALIYGITSCPGLKLKRINFRYNNLSEVTLDTLSTAVCRLEHVDLSETNLTDAQLNAMLCDISKCLNLKIKILTLSHNNLDGVLPDMFVSAVSRLEEIDVSYAMLTDSQLDAIFMRIIQCSDLKLKKLNLARVGKTLPLVNPDTLVSALCSIESVDLRYSSLTNIQWISLFKGINVCKDLKQKTLAITHLGFCEFELPNTILTTAVCKLVNIDLSADLSTDQLEGLLNGIIKCKNLKLKSLYISDNNLLYDVNPDTLALVICKLEEVDITYHGVYENRIIYKRKKRERKTKFWSH